MSVAFLVEASREVGYGHLVRVCALARLVPNVGMAVLGLPDVRALPDAHPPLITPHEARASKVLIRDTRNYIPGGSGQLIVDLCDEPGDAAGDAAIVFALLGDADGRSVRGVRLYAGLRYAILREEFGIPDTGIGHGVLVTLGGSDPSQSTARVVDALLAGGVTDVRAIVGPSNGGSEPACPCVSGSMRDAMVSAALLITSGGMTLIEAGALGKPCIALAHNERERVRILRLVRYGRWFMPGGVAADVELGNRAAVSLCQQVRRLPPDVGKTGPLCVDGKGVERVAAILAKLGTS